MSMTFTKLFSSITESTIWIEDDQTRIVWITMLAMSDSRGRVWASIPGLASRARVPVEDCERALTKFKEPDKYSRTKDNDGRRITDIDGGWRLLNHEKYRSIRDAESIKESKRNYINKRRATERVENVELGRFNAEADTDAEPDTKKNKGRSAPNGYAVPPCFESVDGFSAALAGWIESRQKMRKPATGRAIQILIDRLSEKPTRAIEALNTATERGWLTVKWDWLEDNRKPTQSKPDELSKYRIVA